MKKSLLALAVLGAFASAAQAQVTIGGIVQASAYRYQVSNSARVRESEQRIDDAYPSRFWLTGQEDLGGGNSAIFYIENRLTSTDPLNVGPGVQANAGGLGNGDTFVGMKGSWGQVTAGKATWISAVGLTTEVYNRQNTLAAINADVAITYSLANEMGGAYAANLKALTFAANAAAFAKGAPANTPGSAADVAAQNAAAATAAYVLDTGTRRSNAITYMTPSFGGLVGKLGYSTSGSGNEGTINGTPYYTDGREYFLQGAYTNGPMYANLSYWNRTGEGRNGVVDVKQMRFAGHYLFPFGLKAGLILDQAKTQLVVANASFGPQMSRNVIIVPVSYGFGNSTILGSYGKAYDLKGDATSDAAKSTGASTGATMATLVYDYAFSRRTSAGAYYMKLHNSVNGAYTPLLTGVSVVGGSALATGEQASVLGVTLKHYF